MVLVNEFLNIGTEILRCLWEVKGLIELQEFEIVLNVIFLHEIL